MSVHRVSPNGMVRGQSSFLAHWRMFASGHTAPLPVREETRRVGSVHCDSLPTRVCKRAVAEPLEEPHLANGSHWVVTPDGVTTLLLQNQGTRWQPHGSVTS